MRRGFKYSDRLEAVRLRNAESVQTLYTIPLKLRNNSPVVKKTHVEFPIGAVDYAKLEQTRHPTEPMKTADLAAWPTNNLKAATRLTGRYFGTPPGRAGAGQLFPNRTQTQTGLPPLLKTERADDLANIASDYENESYEFPDVVVPGLPVTDRWGLVPATTGELGQVPTPGPKIGSFVPYSGRYYFRTTNQPTRRGEWGLGPLLDAFLQQPIKSSEAGPLPTLQTTGRFKEFERKFLKELAQRGEATGSKFTGALRQPNNLRPARKALAQGTLTGLSQLSKTLPPLENKASYDSFLDLDLEYQAMRSQIFQDSVEEQLAELVEYLDPTSWIREDDPHLKSVRNQKYQSRVEQGVVLPKFAPADIFYLKRSKWLTAARPGPQVGHFGLMPRAVPPKA